MSRSDTPTLSICVPTYNRQFLLERNVNFHLEAFRNLGLPFEIVIVDDCSTDTTDSYIQSLACHPEVRGYRRTKNSGFLSNYAFAMQRAKGRYAVFLGDDDLLIPEKVLEYVRLMEEDPRIGMVQAPWMLVDGRPGGGDMSPFYQIPAPTRYTRGDFHGMLEFILNFHVFPEFMIIRRDVLSRSISSAAPFIFWAFLYTTRALDKADVLFLPEPFARVTAVSDDPRMQQGNKECMFQWDSYRGGLEYLASHAFRGNPQASERRGAIIDRINQFMLVRKSVALRLHLSSENWAEAYIMYHRIAAYGVVPVPEDVYDLICLRAGLATAAAEATSYSNQPAILDPLIDDSIVSLFPQSLQAKVTWETPSVDADASPRAWVRFAPDFPPNLRPGDAVFDLKAYMAQFN